MIAQRKILREKQPYCIHLSLIKKWDSITEQVQESEKPAKKGLFNKDLQSLVSKLEILRSFSVSTPDIMLAEQIAKAMLDEQKNIGGMVNIHHDLIHSIEFEASECIETI